MAGTKKVVTQQTESAEAVENLILEQRKVKALEKIANSLDALTVWFEEIEKQDWSDRIQYYLYEFHNNVFLNFIIFMVVFDIYMKLMFYKILQNITFLKNKKSCLIT